MGPLHDPEANPVASGGVEPDLATTQAPTPGTRRMDIIPVGRAFGRAGRVPFARRSLLHDTFRVAISTGALAFAVLLVLLLRGTLDGTLVRAPPDDLRRVCGGELEIQES